MENANTIQKKSPNPLVIVRDGEQLDIVTYRADPNAGYVGWRIRWDGDEYRATSDSDAPEVYFLVETCSLQYSEKYDGHAFGVQVWRIARGTITHSAWFEFCLNDPIEAVRYLADYYHRTFAVDIDSLRVVESSDNACCLLVY